MKHINEQTPFTDQALRRVVPAAIFGSSSMAEKQQTKRTIKGIQK